jgi:hypothetical protein
MDLVPKKTGSNDRISFQAPIEAVLCKRILCRDEQPPIMRCAGGLQTVLQTVGEPDDHIRLAHAVLQCVCPKLQPADVRWAIQHILI